MSRSALLLFLLAAACGAEGKGRSTTGHIVGGEPVHISEFPWRVSLEEYLYGRKRHICGGSIIGSTWVLTTGGCVEDSIPQYLTVRAGASDREYGGRVYNVTRIIKHEGFHYDIALLEISEPIFFGGLIQGANLGSSDLANGTEVNITSWSPRAQVEGLWPVQLHAVAMSIVDRGTCRALYKVLHMDVTDSMICAGREGTCADEGGAPLVVGNTLYGLYSWGRSCTAGADHYPGVYTNVAAVRSWITEKTGI